MRVKTLLLSNRLIICAAVAMLAFAPSAYATLLNPSSNVAPSPTASPAGAAMLNDTGVQPFASIDGSSFTGTLRTQVWMNDAGNANGPAALTFTYLLTNNGPDPLEQLSTINFSGYSTDVGFSVGGPAGSIPFSVTRNSTGKILGWQFDPSGASVLPPGGFSAMLVVHTNATQYQQVFDSVINGSVAQVLSFGPAPIPEPATFGLMSAASLAMMAIRRRTSR